MAERERFVAYVTKFALTQGIWPGQVELCADISDTMVSVVGGPHLCYHGNDWHRTEAAAKARAEQMRKAKIAALEKQIARLQKLKF